MSRSSPTSSTRPTAKQNDPSPSCPGCSVVTAQQFYLTDTPCTSGGIDRTPNDRRRPPPPQHPRDLREQNRRRARNQAPRTPFSPELRPTPPPKTKTTRRCTTTPTTHTSRRRKKKPTRGSSCAKTTRRGCNYVPTGVTTPQSQIHRWVTDPFAKNFRMTKKVTLEFYTRALSDELYTGELCVYLFKRHEVGGRRDRQLPIQLENRKTVLVLLNRSGKPSPTGHSSNGNGSGWKMSFTGTPYTIPGRRPARRLIEHGTKTDPRRRSLDHVRPPPDPDPARGRHGHANRRWLGGRRRRRRLRRRPPDRKLPHRRRPPSPARRVDRRRAVATAPGAAPRSPPTTTSRSSPGWCCAGARGAAG